MLREAITERMKTALRAKDTRTLSAVRLIMAALKDRDIAARSDGNKAEIPDTEILRMLQGMIKQRRESIELYEKGKRVDLADKERAEIVVIEKFLPQQMSEAEQETAIKETIAAIGEGTPPPAGETIDHSGKLILPGLVDGHMHTSSSTGWPGIETATKSAAAGGVTTCVDMPYDVPRPVTDAAILADKIGWVERTAHVDMALYGTITKTGGIDAIMTVSAEAERDQVGRLEAWRAQRDSANVAAALQQLKRAAAGQGNIMPASITCAKAGVTTGEWGWTLRQALGEYRAPTGVGQAMRNDVEGLDDIRSEVDRVSRKLGRRMTLLVGKPGLDGHSNGAEQIAVRARDAGMQVVYEGIRLTPEEIVEAAVAKKPHVIGLSILSGSHLPLVKDVVNRLREATNVDIPVVVGGIIPPEDASALKDAGVTEVYTPKDFELNRIMSDLCRIVEDSADAASADAAE